MVLVLVFTLLLWRLYVHQSVLFWELEKHTQETFLDSSSFSIFIIETDRCNFRLCVCVWCLEVVPGLCVVGSLWAELQSKDWTSSHKPEAYRSENAVNCHPECPDSRSYLQRNSENTQQQRIRNKKLHTSNSQWFMCWFYDLVYFFNDQIVNANVFHWQFLQYAFHQLRNVFLGNYDSQVCFGIIFICGCSNEIS